MDIVSDTYIRGGIPQSRYCRSCAHYQVLSRRKGVPVHPRHRPSAGMLARPRLQ